MTDSIHSQVSQVKMHNTQGMYCYISCDDADGNRVLAVCREIKSLGGKYLHDDRRLTGDEWRQQTTEKINCCDTYLLFVTKKLMVRENRFVRNEFFFAKKAGKEMLAVFLDRIQPEEIHDGLKKWFSEINERCECITPPEGASPKEIAALIRNAVHSAPADKKTSPSITANTADTNHPMPEKQPKPSVRAGKTNKQDSDSHVNLTTEHDRKNIRKKIIIGLSSIAALAVMISVILLLLNNPPMNDNPNNFTYDVTRNGLVITSLKDDELTAIRIPEKIDDKPVIIIGESAFSGCGNLKKVRMPDSVRQIEAFAFLSCDHLKNIRISPSVTKIGESAFSDCISLTSMTVPDSVVEIGPSVFQGCASLRSVALPDSLRIIGESAFMNCTSLKKAEIPDSATIVGGSVFEGCTSLSDVRLPVGLPAIGFSSFEGCTDLKKISIPVSVKEIGDYAFAGCTSLTKAVIPASVENIVDTAFSDCTRLTIYGEKGSCAEEYALAHDIPFKEM